MTIQADHEEPSKPIPPMYANSAVEILQAIADLKSATATSALVMVIEGNTTPLEARTSLLGVATPCQIMRAIAGLLAVVAQQTKQPLDLTLIHLASHLNDTRTLVRNQNVHHTAGHA